MNLNATNSNEKCQDGFDVNTYQSDRMQMRTRNIPLNNQDKK